MADRLQASKEYKDLKVREALALSFLEDSEAKKNSPLSDTADYEQVGNVIYLMAVPSKFHEAIIIKLAAQLDSYFDDTLCIVYGSNSGLDFSKRIDFLKQFDEFREYFSDEDYQRLSFLPDLQVICEDDDNKDLWTGRGYTGIPCMVFEVLSPSTMNKDLNIKKVFYERVGIPEYWIIHDIGRVEVYTLINGKYISKEFKLPENSEEVLEVSSDLFKNLVIKFDKRRFFKLR